MMALALKLARKEPDRPRLCFCAIARGEEQLGLWRRERLDSTRGNIVAEHAVCLVVVADNSLSTEQVRRVAIQLRLLWQRQLRVRTGVSSVSWAAFDERIIRRVAHRIRICACGARVAVAVCQWRMGGVKRIAAMPRMPARTTTGQRIIHTRIARTWWSQHRQHSRACWRGFAMLLRLSLTAVRRWGR